MSLSQMFYSKNVVLGKIRCNGSIDEADDILSTSFFSKRREP